MAAKSCYLCNSLITATEEKSLDCSFCSEISVQMKRNFNVSIPVGAAYSQALVPIETVKYVSLKVSDIDSPFSHCVNRTIGFYGSNSFNSHK